MGGGGGIGGVFSGILGLGGQIASGVGVATGNPLLAGIGMGASALGGMFAGNEAGEQAGQYSGLQQALALEQLRMAQEDRERYLKDIYPYVKDIAAGESQLYLDKALPMKGTVLDEVGAPIEDQSGYQLGRSQINRGYSDMAAQLRRTMAGRYPSGSGLDLNAQRNLELGRGQALAGHTATTAAQRLGNMMAASGLVSSPNLPSMPNTSGAYGLASGTMGSIANQYGQQAQSAYGSSGNILGNLALMLMMGGGGSGGISGIGGGATLGGTLGRLF